MIVSVPDLLKPFVGPALVRLRYLHPEVRFECFEEEGGVTIEADPASDIDALRAEVCYAIYREKIYAETLPLRRTLLEAVMGR